MNPQKVVMSQNLEEALTAAVATCEKDRIFILTDETTQQLCLPLVEGFDCLKGAQHITIGATDTHKTLDSLSHVWEALGEGGATRHSLLINTLPSKGVSTISTYPPPYSLWWMPVLVERQVSTSGD